MSLLLFSKIDSQGPPVPPGEDERITAAGDQRITADGNIRIVPEIFYLASSGSRFKKFVSNILNVKNK